MGHHERVIARVAAVDRHLVRRNGSRTPSLEEQRADVFVKLSERERIAMGVRAPVRRGREERGGVDKSRGRRAARDGNDQGPNERSTPSHACPTRSSRRGLRCGRYRQDVTMIEITIIFTNQSPAWIAATFHGVFSHRTEPVRMTTGKPIHTNSPKWTAPNKLATPRRATKRAMM